MKNFSFKSTLGVYGVTFLSYIDIEVTTEGGKKGTQTYTAWGRRCWEPMSSPGATVSLQGWIGLYGWSTITDDCKLFRKDSLGGQGGDVAHDAEEFIKCTEDCYEIGNRCVQSL